MTITHDNDDRLKRIAICITTHNRNDITDLCLSFWSVMKPDNADILIVDDGSEIPYHKANYFRFEKQQGIASAKNKCLELAKDYDYIFLSDNDFWPITSDWWKPFINSGLNHACWIIDRKEIKKNDVYTEYDLPRGCLLFLKNEVLPIVGGMDTDFGLWGYEHASYSDRIFNAGLTPVRYLHINGTEKMFYSLDLRGKVESSVPDNIRAEHIPRNYALYQQKYYSKEFKPFR